MKITSVLFLFAYIFFLISCQISRDETGDFKLLPQPQELEISGNSNLKYNDVMQYCALKDDDLPVLSDLLNSIEWTNKQSDAQIIYYIDDSIALPSEGYFMNISGTLIRISAKDKAGLFYAFKTLEQLMEDAREQDAFLPECSIKDFPSLSYRAIHIDIKHHLEKKEYYYYLLDKLASYKVNAIILEAEDKIKYIRQAAVGSSDAMRIDEWIHLSNYAKERNIEISPLIQGLGHSSFILKHEQYKALRDNPHSDWAFNPLDPNTYKVQFDLYLDAIEATPHGKYLHIGGDEVHTTGRGSGKSALELQLIWLNKVCKFAEENGRIPIFWDDMPLKNAGVYSPMFNTNLSMEKVDSIWKENEPKLLAFLNQFPKNCIYMRWNYSSSQALGNGKAMDWFRNHGLQVMGATAGQTRWVLMPQNESNIDNIRTFSLSSINSGLNGLLLTLWDDDSPHFELYMRGIIAFAEYSWTGEKRTKRAFKAAYRHREFSNALADNKYAFIDRLEQPVAFWKNALLRGNQRNYLQKHNNPMDELVIDLPNKIKKGEWSIQYADRLIEANEVLQSCDSIATLIKTMKSHAIRNNYTLEVYEQVNEMVRFSSKALLLLKTYDSAQTEKENLDALKQIILIPKEFETIRAKLEKVYSNTRILTKAEDYILDQDHHVHLSNQTISFDWQFYAEMLFLEKIKHEIVPE